MGKMVVAPCETLKPLVQSTLPSAHMMRKKRILRVWITNIKQRYYRKGWFTPKKKKLFPNSLFARCELVGGNIELEIEFLKTDSIGCQKLNFVAPQSPQRVLEPGQFQLRSVAQSCGVQDVLPTEKVYTYCTFFFPGLRKQAPCQQSTHSWRLCFFEKVDFR